MGRIGLALCAASLLLRGFRYATSSTVLFSLRDASVRRHRREGPWQFLHAQGDQGRVVVFAHPPSRIEWPLDARPGRYRFTTEVGLKGEDWQRSDGVTFRVALVELGAERELRRFHLEAPATARWHQFSAELTIRDRAAVLVLETDNAPGAQALYDSALWAEPRLDELAPRLPWPWLVSGLALIAVAFWLTRDGAAVDSVTPSFARAWFWTPLRWLGVVALALVTLAIGELLLRRYPWWMPEKAYQLLPEGGYDRFVDRRRDQLFDPQLGYRLAPNQNRHLEWPGDAIVSHRVAPGYRVPDAAFVLFAARGDGFGNPKEAMANEIAVIGDSFVQSSLVARAQSWPAVLAAATGAPVRNLDVSGFSPQQSEVLLRRFALPHRPRLVLFLIYEGKDVSDAGQFQEFVDSRMGWLEFLAKRDRASSASLVVIRALRSLVWALLSAGAGDLYQRSNLAADTVNPIANGLNPVCGEIAAKKLCASFLDYELHAETRSREAWSTDPGWRLLLRAVTDAEAASRAAGARFVVLLAPSKVAVYLPLLEGSYDPRAFDQYVGNFAETKLPDGLTSHDAFRRNHGSLDSLLAESLGMSGFDYIDLLQALLERASEGRQLYLPFDSHWNVEGNRIVGELVAAELVKRGYVP